jgi:hypothetical protein
VGQPPASVLDALACPDDTAAYLAMTAPGPDAAGPLAALDPGRFTQSGRVDALVAIERQMAWLAGLQQRMLATMIANDGGGHSGDQWVREDVACALRLSAITAQRRIAVAQTLVDSLPGTLALLESGAISYLHAMNLAEAVYPLDAETAATVEERVLARAAEQTLSQFKTSVRRAVASAAPARTELQRDEAMAERRVCVTPRDDGMAELWALLPAEGAAALRAAVDALASATPDDDPRSADQRRADALVDLGVAALHDPLLPKAQGMRPSVQVTAAEQRRERDGVGDQAAPGAGRVDGDVPGERGGNGAVSGELARLVVATGALLDRGYQDLPATSQPHGIRHRPRPNLHLPRLPASRAPLRPRPRTASLDRRRYECRQPRCPLPSPPPRQTPSWLAGPTQSAHRRLALAQPHRPRIPLAAAQLPARPHNRPSTTAVLT